MKKRLLACLLTAAMLVSLFPLPALAAEAERPEWMVTAFDPLDGDIAAQTVPQGGEPVLPDSLTAWAYVIEDDTAVIPPPEGLEQESEQPQTDGPEDEQLPAEKQEPVIQPVTIPGVTWEAQPEFAPDAPGEYVYTPVLPAAYVVGEGVELPAITVTVEAARKPEQTAVERVQALIDALPAPEGITLDNAEDTAAQIWDIDGASETLTEGERAALDFTRYEAVMLALAALMDDAPTVLATESDIKYLDWDDNQKKLVEKTYTENATVVDSNTTTWTAGWYVVNRGDAENPLKIDSRVTVTGDVHLILANGCTLNAGMGIGINREGSNSLTIYAQSTDEAVMGALTASGDAWQAGIECGTGQALTINGGKVTATGGTAGAGIGGGDGGSGGTITINGGNVTATGGLRGAGIGGGNKGSGGTITINGGSVTATGRAGIGGGEQGSGGTITINGGTVEAIGGTGIGGGYRGSGGTITINGGSVTANSSYGAGIGGGEQGSGGKITISGGDVTATSTRGGAGIGGGYRGSGGEITITGGTVTATGSNGSPDIGGNGAPTDKIEIGPDATVKNGSGGEPNYGPAHGMNGSKWASDETQHWHPCFTDGCMEASHMSAKESHNVGAQTWVKDNDQHWHNCTICAARTDVGDHNWIDLGWYNGDSLTVNGGVIRGDVSGGDRGYSGLGVSGNSSGDSMDITINGGTVGLTGSNNKIYADSGTVVITGGSVTAGGVAPAPTNGTDPVYAVTVESIGSGTVDAFQLKKDDAVQAYGAPACTTTDGKVILYLPEGTYSGTAIVGGKLVTFNCEASSGAASPSTATDTGVTITTPEGEKPTIDEDGGVTVPDGSTVQTGDGPEITLPDGGTVKQDGTTTTTEGGKAQIGDTTITPPPGGTVTVNQDGETDIPQNSTVQTGDSSPEIKLPDGGSMSGGGITLPDGGTVQTGNPATTITPPNGGKVKPKEDGTVEVPDGTTVKPGDGGPDITVGPGNSGTVGGNGGVTVPGGGKVTVKDDSGDITITLPSGGGTVKPKPDGTIPLPGGAKIEQGGQEITVPDGGGTYHPKDGTVTKDVCTVTFDSQGGSAVSSIIVTLGEKATKPGNPTKSGYTFDGWYKESGCTTAWNFDTDTVTGNITLYAKWTAISDPGGNPGGNGGGGWYNPPTTYSVTIPTTAHGKVTVSPASASRGTTVTITAVPEGGYRLSSINVTSGGKDITLTEKGSGKYTFTMPAGTVKVEAVFVPAETPETPWNNPFADVSEGDWYYEAVQFVQERGLMNGYSDGRFGPNDTLSRAQLAQILFNKEGRPGVNYLMDFSDVAGEAWYTEAIRWATSQGIVGGYGNGTFGPNDPITREQLAVMLWRYVGSPAATNKELHFNDESEISGFALEALRWAVENGILNGYGDGRLGPQGQATRAQVAQMLKNFIENQEEENT